MPVLAFNSSEEFSRLISGLASDAVAARIHFTHLRALYASIEEYEVEFNQSPTFWNLVFEGHLEVTMVRLARVYEHHDDTLNLRNWLDTIEANIDLFDRDRFRERKKENPFVESLAAVNRLPDRRELAKDIAIVSSSDSLVKKLIIHRHNLFAHRSATFTREGRNPAREYPLSPEDLDTLTSRAVSIVNKYSGLFQAETFSDQMVGADDYRFVLEAARFAVRQAEEDIAGDAS